MPLIGRRRLLLSAVAGLAAAGRGTALAHGEIGRVTPPQPSPDVGVKLADGTTTTLPKVLAGRITAVQLMFTTCRSTCPIQGALFAEGARKLGDRVPDAQWMSLTIDPVHDDGAALTAWQARFGLHPRWVAGSPDPARLDELVSFLKSKKPGPDPHTAQAYYFNRRSELVLRSVDLPSATELIRLFEVIGAQG
jgi:protein SCO1/2